MAIKILAIETSCDETSVAIISSDKEIIAHHTISQTAHEIYGGVVPEIASRAHLEHLNDVIAKVMQDAKMEFSQLDAIASTAGPGLIGGVIIGVMSAKMIASLVDKPFIAVNHLEGHALTARLTNDVPYPFLLLLISGGHCQILAVLGLGKYEKFGETLDDALGEAFDKVAKMLELGYPGGPIVEKFALKGDENRFNFPIPMKGKKNCDFSFSGLKTAVRNEIIALKHENGEVTEQDKFDICASFQKIVGEILKSRMKNAIALFKEKHASDNIVMAGGVAANKYLFGIMSQIAAKNSMKLTTPPMQLCTDNAAMIGWVAIEKFLANQFDSLDFEPKARWPLFN